MRHRATITVNADFFGKQYSWSDTHDYAMDGPVDARWLEFIERVWSDAKLAMQHEASRCAAEQKAIADAAALQAAQAAIIARRRSRDRRMIPARLVGKVR